MADTTEMPVETKPVNPHVATTCTAGPIGLTAFGITTILLNFLNAELIGKDTITLIICYGMFHGGMIQILAGMWEVYRGNIFGGYLTNLRPMVHDEGIVAGRYNFWHVLGGIADRFWMLVWLAFLHSLRHAGGPGGTRGGEPVALGCYKMDVSARHQLQYLCRSASIGWGRDNGV